jgi:hypothetical protein
LVVSIPTGPHLHHFHCQWYISQVLTCSLGPCALCCHSSPAHQGPSCLLPQGRSEQQFPMGRSGTLHQPCPWLRQQPLEYALVTLEICMSACKVKIVCRERKKIMKIGGSDQELKSEYSLKSRREIDKFVNVNSRLAD